MVFIANIGIINYVRRRSLQKICLTWRKEDRILIRHILIKINIKTGDSVKSAVNLASKQKIPKRK